MLLTHNPMIQLTRSWPFLHWQNIGMETRAAGWMAVGISLVSGSTFTPFAKALSGALTPLTLVFVSELLTLSFVALSFGIIPMLRELARSDKTTLRALLGVGIASGVLGPLLWFAGLQYTSAVNAIFFGKVEAVFLLFLASKFVHEKVTRGHVLASGITILGGVVIALKGFTDGLMLAPGDLMIIASAMSYSLGSCIFRKYLSHVKTQIAVLARAIIAISAFFLISPFIERAFIDEVISFPPYLIPTLLGFAFISRFLNTFAFYEAAERLELSVMYPVFMLDAIGSAVVAHLILGETLHWYHVFGGALILLGNFVLYRLGIHRSEEHLEEHAVQRVAMRAA